MTNTNTDINTDTGLFQFMEREDVCDAIVLIRKAQYEYGDSNSALLCNRIITRLGNRIWVIDRQSAPIE